MKIVTWLAVGIMLAVAVVIFGAFQLLLILNDVKDQTVDSLRFAPKGRHRRCKEGIRDYGTRRPLYQTYY